MEQTTDVNLYQKFCETTDRYPNSENNILFYILGYVEEAGEVAGKIKKIYRDNNGIFSEEKKKEVILEIGDQLWYTARLCSILGYNLEDVLFLNKSKLQDRVERNAIHGSGDNR